MPFLLDRTPLAAGRSLLDTRSLSADAILSLFKAADRISDKATHNNQAKPGSGKTVCCLFFEPSTRTRMSFQMAAYQLGCQVLNFEGSASSSLVKGETYTDTLLNIAAMGPDAIVIRYGESPELDALLPRLSIPVINGGSGSSAHPTQALLDAYTLYRERGRVDGERVLIVGDIRHSRVARSNFDVLAKLGARIGICAPEALLPKQNEYSNIEVFSRLDEAIEWCTVYMGLRIQLERHSGAVVQSGEYHQQFGLTEDRLKKLSKDAMIMHPGPINHGVEFAHAVSNDSRNRVLQQVANGVSIRAAILESALR